MTRGFHHFQHFLPMLRLTEISTCYFSLLSLHPNVLETREKHWSNISTTYCFSFLESVFHEFNYCFPYHCITLQNIWESMSILNYFILNTRCTFLRRAAWEQLQHTMCQRRLKSKHFQVEFMLHIKPSTEDCCSAVGERESYYLAGTNGLIKTTFTQKG